MAEQIMSNIHQEQAAAAFAERWQGKGYEKGESQKFWIDLLGNVLGVEQPTEWITFEEQVKLDHTSFIDGHIARTHVLIEQKSLGKDLRAPIKQSDGSMLSPFQQAKRYAAELPYSQRPRWIVTCNFSDFLIYDMEQPNGEPEHIELKNLGKEYYRLQFLVNTGDAHIQREMEISLKAGQLVGMLYDKLLEQYIDPNSAETLRSLNILCVRLVFCLYAEDAGVFPGHDMFHDYLASFNPQNVRKALIDLFRVLDTKEEDRDPYMEDNLKAFPYVNGGLFAEAQIEVPRFTEEIVTMLLNNASLGFDWSGISPTIFGAVFESTLNPDTRRSGGMHYTSIENIHKVIDPLFLDELRGELDAAKNDRQLKALQTKLASLTFLDPACGSGNFLTETYISLRRIENEIILRLSRGQVQMGFSSEFSPIKVSISQFYGIEINDFAVTVARTALWIAEHQMLKETQKIVFHDLDFLPLKSYNHIIEGNAMQTNWESVVPKEGLDYIMGNPPFVGQAMRTKEQADEMQKVFAPLTIGGKLDYVAGWYKKAADLIQGTSTECAFVSTNSICQGESVNLLWKYLLERGLFINFAHTTFKWTSESSNSAAVMCVIVGFSYKERPNKILFAGEQRKEVAHINGYLKNAPDVFIQNRTKSVNGSLAKVVQGSPPADDGRLLLSREEKEWFVGKYPELAEVIKPFVGSKEFINDTGFSRFCFWFVGKAPSDYQHIPELMERFAYIREFRLKSPVDRIQKTADKPYLFTQNRQPQTNYLIIPRVSSETRRYIPIGFLTPDVIASDAAVLVNDATLYDFGLLCSNVHNAWMRTVAGRLEMRYRYAPSVYYNFPFPSPTAEQKASIEQTAQAIIDARQNYPTKSLAKMYGSEMYLYPDLLQAHQNNDRAVMQAYGFPVKNFTEQDCVARLMEMYKEMTK